MGIGRANLDAFALGWYAKSILASYNCTMRCKNAYAQPALLPAAAIPPRPPLRFLGPEKMGLGMTHETKPGLGMTHGTMPGLGMTHGTMPGFGVDLPCLMESCPTCLQYTNDIHGAHSCVIPSEGRNLYLRPAGIVASSSDSSQAAVEIPRP